MSAIRIRANTAASSRTSSCSRARLLQRAAASTRNQARSSNPQGEKIVYFRPLWSRFVLAAIIVFLLDLLVRRVRLFDRKFLPRRSLPPPSRAA